MIREKHSKPIKFGLFLSVLLLTTFSMEAFFGVPKSDHYYLLQKIICFLLSLIVSGAFLAYMPKNTVRAVIAFNVVLLLIVYIVK
jgi:cell division protein FtsW (lipid II flippase)